MAVTVETDPTFQAGRPQQLFSGPYLEAGGVQYDFTSDGQRFLMLKPAETTADGESEINIVLNWHNELLERVPIP